MLRDMHFYVICFGNPTEQRRKLDFVLHVDLLAVEGARNLKFSVIKIIWKRQVFLICILSIFLASICDQSCVGISVMNKK